MKKYNLVFLNFLLILMLSQFFGTGHSWAYWIWTPEIGKWINPKYAVKNTAEEQFDWARGLYEEKEYSKAADEFDKLVFNYPQSKYAAQALYYKGICLEEIGYFYEAYSSYDRVLREYPAFENINELVEREYKIGERFFLGEKRKVMGMKIFPSQDLAVEVFTSISEHAPFSEYGAKAQFNVGVTFKNSKQYVEAKEAFEKVILNYPNSSMVEKARFEMADCSYQASKKAEYEQTTTRKAIDEFNQFLSDETDDGDLSQRAMKQLLILQEKDAEHLFRIAEFYKRIKQFESAGIYYKEIINKYPQTSWAAKAEELLLSSTVNNEKK